ncbi:MAG: DoxX family protein [Caldilineaceae bacterium]|nr:DoxX family protein [Caldilineaceae bacterium]
MATPRDQVVISKGVVTIADPPWSHALFDTTRFAWLWLLIRLYASYEWLHAGWGKFNNPAWWSGEALAGFWRSAVQIPAKGQPPISFGWYRSFIQFMLDNQAYAWFGKLVTFGEMAVGTALLLGALVGIAAFLGAFMNWNFIMAGSASTNGLLFALAIALMLAWKVAGWYGLDRWLLPLLGTPWQRPAEVVTLGEPPIAHAPR